MLANERPFLPVLVLALREGTREDMVCVRNEDIRAYLAGEPVEVRCIAKRGLLPASHGSERWFYCEWRSHPKP